LHTDLNLLTYYRREAGCGLGVERVEEVVSLQEEGGPGGEVVLVAVEGGGNLELLLRPHQVEAPGGVVGGGV
jgi:hypothetical protein